MDLALVYVKNLSSDSAASAARLNRLRPSLGLLIPVDNLFHACLPATSCVRFYMSGGRTKREGDAAGAKDSSNILLYLLRTQQSRDSFMRAKMKFAEPHLEVLFRWEVFNCFLQQK